MLHSCTSFSFLCTPYGLYIILDLASILTKIHSSSFSSFTSPQTQIRSYYFFCFSSWVLQTSWSHTLSLCARVLDSCTLPARVLSAANFRDYISSTNMKTLLNSLSVACFPLCPPLLFSNFLCCFFFHFCQTYFSALLFSTFNLIF